MDPVANPYRPGAGRRPPVLAGREPLLAAFDVMLERVDAYGEGDRAWVLSGLRGVGKTVLLNELQAQAERKLWIVAKVEVTVQTPLPVALSTSLLRALRTATGRHPDRPLSRLLGVFKSFSATFNPATAAISVGADVDLIKGIADTGRFADDLTGLLETLGETSKELGIGTLVLIDELQEASTSDLIAVNTAVHHVGQAGEPLPVLVVGAGLPSLPAQLADATSYAERLYDYRPVGLLPPEASRTALEGPSAERGASWHSDALAHALDIARGYPYFLQAVGKHVWDVAKSTTITIEDAELGGTAARAEVDAGLYQSRWERATPAQKNLLRAMAGTGGDGPSEISALVTATGKKRVGDLSVARNELIKKGLVYPPERGLLAFTVPGMSAFISRQP